MKFIVTAGKNSNMALSLQAQKWAEELEVAYVPRGAKGTLEDMLTTHAVDCILVATQTGPRIFTTQGYLSYHPSMAVLRIENILKGEADHFATACGLRPGMRVLDCTLGLAADAAIAAHIAGEQGVIVGLEASTPLWFLVRYGLDHYVDKNPALNEALRRVVALNIEALAYLQMQEDDNYDVIYFDPMFKRPVMASSSMQPLRPVTYHGELTPEHIKEALRVAPKVVIKETSQGVLARLGVHEIVGGKYSKVKYGIIRR